MKKKCKHDWTPYFSVNPDYGGHQRPLRLKGCRKCGKVKLDLKDKFNFAVRED